MNKRNDFICIGAAHSDFILRLKQNYYKNRTNPIKQQENIGGVAYNIAKILSFLNQRTVLYSLNCNLFQKKEIKRQGIRFQSLNTKIQERYYTSVLDKNGKMILGLANMDNYEQLIDYKKLKNFINKKIILDLNLSINLIEKIINNNFKKNYICVCGTSAHKVYKIKKLLKKIDTIILNKQESFTLTNKKTIKDSMNYLIKQNKNLNIIITNGKNSINAHLERINYLVYPPPTIIKNENGAGDALIAIFNYFFCNYFNKLDSLNRGVCAGSLQASGYKVKKKIYLQKIDSLSRSIIFKITK
jgi:pseudouridine kinase